MSALLEEPDGDHDARLAEEREPEEPEGEPSGAAEDGQRRERHELVGDGIEERAELGELLQGAGEDPVEPVRDQRTDEHGEGRTVMPLQEEPDEDGNGEKTEPGEEIGDVHRDRSPASGGSTEASPAPMPASSAPAPALRAAAPASRVAAPAPRAPAPASTAPASRATAPASTASIADAGRRWSAIRGGRSENGTSIRSHTPPSVK